MPDIGQLCAHLIRLVHAPIRVYDRVGTLTAIFVDKGEQQDVLSCDRAMRDELLALARPDGPVLHLELGEILYGVFGADEQIYILGPCCLGADPVAAARLLVRRHRMDAKKPVRIPRVALEHFCEVLLILYEALTGQTISLDELYLQSFAGDDFIRATKGKLQSVLYGLRETGAVHNPYAQEAREQDAIQNGDLDALYRSFQETYTGQIGTLARDPLRQAKNLAIVLITLASRSAIRGGLLPEIAYSMSDAFIQRTEELSDLGQAQVLGKQAEIEYCKAVAELAGTSSASPLVTRCKNIVARSIHEKLSVKDLARQLDVSADHLSRQFARETGEKLTDFILQAKVRAAKDRLIYTGDSYESIAMELGFTSQSHFGQVFKRYAGMTPKRFRDLYTAEQPAKQADD